MNIDNLLKTASERLAMQATLPSNSTRGVLLENGYCGRNKVSLSALCFVASFQSQFAIEDNGPLIALCQEVSDVMSGQDATPKNFAPEEAMLIVATRLIKPNATLTTLIDLMPWRYASRTPSSVQGMKRFISAIYGTLWTDKERKQGMKTYAFKRILETWQRDGEFNLTANEVGWVRGVMPTSSEVLACGEDDEELEIPA
jgi:hypothetical protein